MPSVAMPPSPSTSRSTFQNKPYYHPNLTLRRSSRLLASESSPARTDTRRQHSSAPQPSSSKRRRTSNATPTTPTTTDAVVTAPALATPPVAPSSKRKADSIEEEEDNDDSPAVTRRKKRKENAISDKVSHSLAQMRPTIRNIPRPRSSTNKYGTRSATSSSPTDDAVNLPPVLEGPPPEQQSVPREPSPPPPEKMEEVLIDPSPCPPPVDTLIIASGETLSTPLVVDPLQQDVLMYIPEAPVPSPPTTSYVTYTDLTPSFPDRQYHHDAAVTPSPQPSLLSELHDGFAFSCDPDLDPHIAFAPPPLQEQTDAMAFGGGPAEEEDWAIQERQRQQIEYEKQKKEAMKALQRQDQLWISWTSKKFNTLIAHYGGIGEVRALLKAQIQRAEACNAGSQSSNKENTTGPASSPPSTPPSVDDSYSLPLIQPSFEMYSPETDEIEIGEKSDMEDEEDEEDSDSSADDDMVPEPEVNPHFELPPAPVLSPHKTNPCSGRLVLFGTPPFLERRKAWGGDNLLVLSMKSSAEMQQVRPQKTVYSPPLDLSFAAPPVHSHYTEAPSSSSYSSSPGPSYQECIATSNTSSGDLATNGPSYDDPSIMQAIINCMGPDWGIDWTDGMMGASLADINNRGWQTPPPLEESPSLPRSSHTLSASSSTLHSALG